MLRTLSLLLIINIAALPAVAIADVVTDWNITLNEAIIATPTKHNPGNPTRAMAMMNSAIYDVFQAVNRTHQPFKVNLSVPAADLNAAVARAAYHVITDTYGEQQSLIDDALDLRLGAGPYTPAQLAGIALGDYIGQHYVNAHVNDGHSLPDAYTPTIAPGHWSPDPSFPGQKGWGSDWGFVTPWAMPNPQHFSGMVGPPAFGTQEYVDAFNQVKDFGARISPSRLADQTEIGIFWAYDRPNILPDKPGVGPPPVLFVENMVDIAEQIGNTPADNARMFAMASVAQADAAIAAWHFKYEYDVWRPITAIRADAAHDDDDPNTVEDAGWDYLGAPGHDPNATDDDFTPPFPAYTSGHATMGGAIFKALELFYGTNDFSLADAAFGADPVDTEFVLSSNEPGSGGPRTFVRFTQDGPLGPGLENSPEGENGMSRVYLGVHWLFDQVDGMALGNAIAQYAAGHYFQAVPEPTSMLLGLFALVRFTSVRRRK